MNNNFCCVDFLVLIGCGEYTISPASFDLFLPTRNEVIFRMCRHTELAGLPKKYCPPDHQVSCDDGKGWCSNHAVALLAAPRGGDISFVPDDYDPPTFEVKKPARKKGSKGRLGR